MREQFRMWPRSLDSALVGVAVPFLLLLSQAGAQCVSAPGAQLSAPERAHGQQILLFQSSMRFWPLTIEAYLHT